MDTEDVDNKPTKRGSHFLFVVVTRTCCMHYFAIAVARVTSEVHAVGTKNLAVAVNKST